MNFSPKMSTILYYVALYVTVIVVNFFKVLRENKTQDSSTPAPKFNWRKVFFISNEIIYTASGVYILLLEKQAGWIPFIVVILILLVVVSSNLDSMSEKFSDKAKFRAHVFIVIIVVSGTFMTFAYDLDLSQNEKIEKEKQNTKDSSCVYKVNICYTDKSLIKHLGYEKFGDRFLSTSFIVNAFNERIAIDIATKKFWCDTLIQPVLNKEKKKKNELLKISETEIFVEKYNK